MPRSARLLLTCANALPGVISNDAPFVATVTGEFRKLFEKYLRDGYIRARIDGSVVDLEDTPALDRRKNHTVEIVVDRLVNSVEPTSRLEDSVRQAIRMADGLVVASVRGGDEILFSERMACIDCGVDVPTLEPRSFSFNSKLSRTLLC